MNQILINNQNVLIKEYEGKRVITFKDIDMVHNRPQGTARKRFNDNKKHFIEGEDFYILDQPSEIRTLGITRPQGGTPQSVTLIAESGYLMLAKSLTDDLSWDVQRKLVNDYFTVKDIQQRMTSAEIIAGIANNAVEMERKQKMLEAKQREQQKEIENVNTRLDNMVDVISLDKNSWRKDSQHLISKIATKIGGFECMKNVYQEVFKLVEERAGVALGTRLTNKRNRMAGEGVCKSKRDRFTKIDIIAEDKKLIEIYVAIVKEMAVKYGVCQEEHKMKTKIYEELKRLAKRYKKYGVTLDLLKQVYKSGIDNGMSEKASLIGVRLGLY